MLVRALFAERERGETPAMAARLAPDFLYRAHGSWPMWPYRRGPLDRAQFLEASRRFSAEVELLGSDIHEFLTDGESAAAHVTCHAGARGAGAPGDFDLWIFLRLREALIVELAVYVDAAKAAKRLPAGLVEVRAPDGRARPQASQPGERPEGSLDSPGPAADARRRAYLRRIALDFFALRAKGDYPAMLGRLASDFIHNPRGDWTKPPLMADPCDRATFAESLRLINIEYEDLGGEVHEFVADGDRVAAHRTIKLRNRGSGAVAEVDEWVCFRIAAGLIAEMASYVDNAGILRLDRPAYAAQG
ncbi:ketosteroid isomerase-like protein [Roseiarcus fermentans]|uniref:Ketosteroid isomerase-like protein n=1 Tax=Roseiarcus fermentans TaxID=1473586 RepID=A0A366FGN7_9HYPH|nr:ketosteroid isomerase-like protein [Roseiarcus fermentans]